MEVAAMAPMSVDITPVCEQLRGAWKESARCRPKSSLSSLEKAANRRILQQKEFAARGMEAPGGRLWRPIAVGWDNNPRTSAAIVSAKWL
jgi:hypothetical protein